MTPKKILIVEDDMNLARALRLKFQKHGFDSTACYGGEEAIEMMLKQKFDIVLLDILMPGKDGYVVLAEKAGTMNKTTPVHVLTALGQEENLVKAKELGATRCFVKSKVSINEVVDHIMDELHMK